MPARFRRFVESILYAGLKPNAPSKEPKRGRRLGFLLQKFERLLAGSAPTDPLYLSHRTWKQKVKLGIAIALPCLVLVGAMALGFSNIFQPSYTPAKEPTAAEIVSKMLPDIDKNLNIEVNQDAEIVEVRAQKGPSPRVEGLLRNRSNRPISVEFTFELTDDAGSRIGAVTGRVDKAPPKNAIPFQFPIKQTNAAFALLRDMKTVQ